HGARGTARRLIVAQAFSLWSAVLPSSLWCLKRCSMPVEIRVPTLGESILEATIGRWLKQVGERVNLGEPLVELETDKVNTELPADEAGILESILRREGETVKPGDALGVIATDGGAEAKPAAPPERQPAPEAAP